jgi:hypothetical protein
LPCFFLLQFFRLESEIYFDISGLLPIFVFGFEAIWPADFVSIIGKTETTHTWWLMYLGQSLVGELVGCLSFMALGLVGLLLRL